MTLEDSRKTHFALSYKQLELDDRADWAIARANYRRLVHLWHPDKFTGKPREREHAQQQFINLTKSYNELRDFYKENKRMPFQSMSSARGVYEPSPDVQNQSEEVVADSQTLDSSVLSRDPATRGNSRRKPGKAAKIAWVLAGMLIMGATVFGFLIMDRNANRAVAEKGREVVKEAPESGFMPSAADIRRSQTRGAFVKPTQ